MGGKGEWGLGNVKELSKWKRRAREDSHQLNKKWAFIIYSFEMQKQGGRYWTYPTKPSSIFHANLHWKACRDRVKTKAYVLHVTMWGSPWASSYSHMLVNMLELQAEARQTALVPPLAVFGSCTKHGHGNYTQVYCMLMQTSWLTY